MFVCILALAFVYRDCNEDIVFDAAASNTHGMPASPSISPLPRRLRLGPITYRTSYIPKDWKGPRSETVCPSIFEVAYGKKGKLLTIVLVISA